VRALSDEQYPPLADLITYDQHFDERGAQRLPLWTTRKGAIRLLRDQLEDARGESGSCSDNECGCHAVPARIELMLEELGITEETQE
jgi:hypothetical protein